jgi:hypothetical protein
MHSFILIVSSTCVPCTHPYLTTHPPYTQPHLTTQLPSPSYNASAIHRLPTAKAWQITGISIVAAIISQYLDTCKL